MITDFPREAPIPSADLIALRRGLHPHAEMGNDLPSAIVFMFQPGEASPGGMPDEQGVIDPLVAAIPNLSRGETIDTVPTTASMNDSPLVRFDDAVPADPAASLAALARHHSSRKV